MINIHTGSRFAAFLLTALVLAMAHAAEPGGEVLGNADIVNMTRANTSPMVIVNRIYSAANNFDLSDQAFLQLKESGVADEVLNAMLAAAKAGNAASAVNNALAAPAALPPLGSSGANLAPPSLSLPPLGGVDSSLTPPPLPGQQSSSSPSFSDMPGFGELPAFGEMPGTAATPPSAASGSAFSAPPASPGLTPPPVMSQQAPTPAPVSAQPAFSPPPAAPTAPISPLPTRPQPASPPPAAVSVRPAAPAPSASAPDPRSAQSGGLDTQRFERELVAIVQGAPDTQRTGLAWMLANQEQTLPILRRALDAANPDYQASALRVLGAMNDRNSIPKMRDSLGNPSPLVRQYAAQALAEMNDLVAIGAAEKNLGSDINPRDGLIRLVGYARLARAAEALGTILANDETALNRAAAAWSLSEIGPAGAIAWPSLEKALLRDADAMVRREAASAVAAFHVAGSGKLLQSACRRDPEVRKITLAAMAEYPETVEFLVGVMNLGTGQIAPDELETAARSLAKLTGQNFFLDGNRWQAWFNENKSRFAQTTQNLAGVLTDAPSPGRTAVGRTEMGAGLPPPRRNDEISRMGIVVDPNEIPMAPEVEDRYARRGGGSVVGGGGPVRAPNIDTLIEYDPNAPLPDALSVTDFEAPPPAATANEVGAPATAFGQSGGAQTQAPAPFSSQWGEGISVDLPSASSIAGGGDEQVWGGPSATPAAPSAMPTQSVVGQPAGSMTSGFGGGADSGAGAGGGLRLALPPIGDSDLGGDGGMPSTMLGTVAAGSSIAAPIDTDSSPSGGLSAGESMLFDSSPSVTTYSADDPGLSTMMEQSYGAPDSLSSPVAAPVQAMGSDSIPMDAILHDGFTGEVIVPKAGVDAMTTTAASTFESFDAMQPVPEAVAVPDAMQIPETADSAEPVETLSFPGDTSSFGLGDPLFTESGPTAEYEFDAAGSADVPMPALPGGGASATAAPGDPLAAGLLGAMDEPDGTEAVQDGGEDQYEYAEGGGETFEPYEDPSGSVPPPGEVYTLPPETAAQGGEIETYADDSDSMENMEWVRGVGFVKRATPVAKPDAGVSGAQDASSYYVEPPVVHETGNTQSSSSGWSDGSESTGEYEVLEEGYLTAPGEGTTDFFDASSMPPVSEGIITSPSGPPLLGQEIILDVPEDTSGTESSGKPSRRLRKKR